MHQIQKRTADTHKQPNTETRCRYSQCNQIQKRTADTHNATNTETHCRSSQCQPNIEMCWNTTTLHTETHCWYSQCNQIQKRTAILTMQPNTENARQILTMQPNTETCWNTHSNKIENSAANTHNNKFTQTRCRYSQQPNTENVLADTLNATKYRNVLQILTTTTYRNMLQILTMQPNIEMCCKLSQCKRTTNPHNNQIHKHAANSTDHNGSVSRGPQQVTNLARICLLFNVYSSMVLSMTWKVFFIVFVGR